MKSISQIVQEEEIIRRNKILDCNELLVAALDSNAPSIQKLKFVTTIFSFSLKETKKFLDEWKVRNDRTVYEIYCTAKN